MNLLKGIQQKTIQRNQLEGMCETVRLEEFRISLKRQRKNSTNFSLAVYLNFAKIRVDNSIDSERFSYCSVDKIV